jgi:transaldolase
MYNEKVKFSLWCDFLERDFIDGEFNELIKNGTINGATSNPSIFKNAFLNSPAYTEAKEEFKKKEPKSQKKLSILTGGINGNMLYGL